jgi:hypothetical protein
MDAGCGAPRRGWAVARRSLAADDDLIDANGKIVGPGLIDRRLVTRRTTSGTRRLVTRAVVFGGRRVG